MLVLSTGAASWAQTILWLLPCYLRLEIWWPLVGTAGIFAAYRLYKRGTAPCSLEISAMRAIAALLWFAGAVRLRQCLEEGAPNQFPFIV